MTITLIKPKNFHAILEQIAEEAREYNITFQQNSTNGYGSGYGFSGEYNVYNDHILITVIRRPFFISDSKIEREVREYWAKKCA